MHCHERGEERPEDCSRQARSSAASARGAMSAAHAVHSGLSQHEQKSMMMGFSVPICGTSEAACQSKPSCARGCPRP